MLNSTQTVPGRGRGLSARSLNRRRPHTKCKVESVFWSAEECTG